jgi:uncharacterized cupredoxin-like copper-binding protein
MRKWLVVVVAVVSVTLVSGCSSREAGGEATVLNLTTTGMAFTPKDLSLDVGKAVKLVFKNEDSVLHDLSIDTIAVSKKVEKGDKHNDHGKEPDLHVAADAGKTGTVEFTPKAVGTYTFYCTVPGHKDAGMVGTLTVK